MFGLLATKFSSTRVTCGAFCPAVDFVDQAGKRKDLPLADELLVEIPVKLLNLFAKGPGYFGLLDALRIRQLYLAKLQNLPVIERQGQHADQQHGAEYQPENSRPVGEHRFKATEVQCRKIQSLVFYGLGRAGRSAETRTAAHELRGVGRTK